MSTVDGKMMGNEATPPSTKGGKGMTSIKAGEASASQLKHLNHTKGSASSSTMGLPKSGKK